MMFSPHSWCDWWGIFRQALVFLGLNYSSYGLRCVIQHLPHGGPIIILLLTHDRRTTI